MHISLGSLTLVAALGAGCGSDGGSSVTAPAPATLTSVQLTGNTELVAVGQTSQLTLTGIYSDGSTRSLNAESTLDIHSAGDRNGVRRALHLWANDTRRDSTGSSITANVPTGGGQSLVYVGWLRPSGSGAQYTNFELSVD